MGIKLNLNAPGPGQVTIRNLSLQNMHEKSKNFRPRRDGPGARKRTELSRVSGLGLQLEGKGPWPVALTTHTGTGGHKERLVGWRMW